MKKILATSLLMLFFIGNIFADEITFTASAPGTVIVDKHFRLEYTVNTTDNVGNPSIGDLKGFEILAGPSISQSFSSRSINGKTTSSHTITFTYTLLPKETGEFTIPGAAIKAGGKSITSNPVTIKVLPADSKQEKNDDVYSISDEDIFIKATVSKTKAYENEALLVTYKLYTLVDISGIVNFNPPSFDGFYAPKIDTPSNLQFDMERYNGRNYYTSVLGQYLLQPMKNGKLKIDPMTMGVVVSRTVVSNDPFSLFSGFPETVRMNKNLESNALEINVAALPKGAPDSFTGAVGDFTVSSTISSTDLSVNSNPTFRVVVEGTGNLNLIEAPKVELPVEFDSYPPVEIDEYKLKKDSYKGRKVYEYVITPNSSGSYTIPGVEFSFFNTKSGRYETLLSDSINVDVKRAQQSASTVSSAPPVSKVRGELLAQDIRHIKSDNGTPAETGGYLFASSVYLLLYLCPVLVLLFFFVLYRKNLKENANVSLVRTKKANKMAVRRLKNAKKLMRQGNSREFYDEVLKALWGYFSDKLSIPVAELTKDNIENELLGRRVSETSVAQLKALLDECEFAHYAPGAAGNSMENIYNQSVNVIGDMENSIK